MTGLLAHEGGGVGDSAPRPDGRLKVTGAFDYASDLTAPDMLHGATVRSPHACARITAVDVAEALALPGVRAVLTHEDVPGAKFYGLDVADQPVLAVGEVRYWGEPVAIVAAEDEDTARAAVALIKVGYEPLEALTDPRRAAFDPGAPRVHPDGNLVRYQPVRLGDPDRMHAEVVVIGEYEVGMQDQAPLGPEAALALPTGDGIEVRVATQALHTDRDQIAPCLGLPVDKVLVTLAGVGGAFGAREDLSVQVHAAMLALRTGRPVRMVLNRAESFVGHVHRHPARMRYEHGATSAGKLVYVKAEILLDGGAYTSSTNAVVGNAASMAVGPYEVAHAQIDAFGVRTNNPPCGAMRGFGAVQTCFAYESQMDKIAERVGLDPVEVRAINAVRQGSRIITGQRIDAPAPLAQMLYRARELPEPPPSGTEPTDLPGGVANVTRGEGVVRGTGYAVGIKNICFSEGYDDYSTARVQLSVVDGEPTALVHTAAAEVGQGGITIQAQIARTELGVDRVVLATPDTTVGSAGSTSASRQSYMTGGAVKVACEAVREQLLARLGSRVSADVSLVGGKVVSRRDGVIATIAEVLGDIVLEETREFHHHKTSSLDPQTGQGDSHTQFAFCVHRAVVDVDVELGLVKVVELAAVQDVGKIINRQSIEGQIHGGSAQGLGLALMEEIQVGEGVIRNPDFTDYLIPTSLDMPPMRMEILENADPRAPYGLRGVGEPPTLSSTPAVVAAIRAATGRPVTRVPVRPWDLVGV
ncbi:carbon-monoxide dehydrogenase large subunit [Actinorhabdospora filicis]|uniref:Carbon-monoxide dehydrogenase large subunit n=1 Tax=Actinorhabdospora filicis TaxID=1785913 RepID=A0A9W6W9H8_9ACTN|nr:xanthine dehydrogenase subunit D [Actinorhabdospora filicis]GLZ77556.1 carbon-monoxide dehydrogenase large subunit [Actinorhabdospora filicis]